jgi:hypothetical protein
MDGPALKLRDWYFGVQCQNQGCQRFLPLFEIDSGRPFSVAEGTGRILAECPHCHTDGAYLLTQGHTLQVLLKAKPSVGIRQE